MKAPKLIGLDEAVKGIRAACGDGEDGEDAPYFYLVGSGISYPPVPTAAQIIQHCREKVAAADAAEGETVDLYSSAFQAAYPHPRQRQKYLRSLIERKPLSQANLRLAHLLLDRRIGSAVVTPNFDDFLSRTLTLFGQPHIVCDHPRTVERIDFERDDIQIVHVHGSYWFYDCANLRGEIEDRATASPETTLTMSALLDRILSNRVPLVVGYAGWEGDVIMASLKRRLQHALPYNLYWFCYHRSNIDTLPQWLTGHPEVHFVVPDEAPRRAAPDGVEAGRQPGLETSASTDPPALSAQTVFERLIAAFALPAPPLTRDPLRFFAQHLRGSLLLDGATGGEGDLYRLQHVIDQLDRAAKWAESSVLPHADESDRLLEPMRDALRRADFRSVIGLGSALTSEQLDAFGETRLHELISTLWSAATGLNDNSETELEAYVRIEEAARLLEERSGPIREGATAAQLAGALNSRGYILGELDRPEEAIAAYSAVVQRFGDSADPELQTRAARALVNSAIELSGLRRGEESLHAYQEVIRRYGDSAEPAIQRMVSQALLNSGNRLAELDRREEAIAASRELVRRFGDAPDPASQRHVGKALVNSAVYLAELKRLEEAVDTYDEVIRRFGESTDPEIQKQVAKAFSYRGLDLSSLGRTEEAIAAYDETARRFGQSTDPELQKQVVEALINKAVDLSELGRREEAIGAYEEVIRGVGDSTDPDLQRLVARALTGRAYRLAELDRRAEAVAAHEEIIRRFGDAPDPELQTHVAVAMVTSASQLRDLGRNDDAASMEAELVRRFADTSDPSIREMVDSVARSAAAPTAPEGSGPAA